jgi:plastocyanin
MRRVLALMAIVVAIVALGACGGNDDNKSSSGGSAPIDMTGKAEVEIDAQGGNQFSPANIRIDTGTKVTWANKDSIAHNVKKSADALDFGAPFGVDAGQFNPGDTYAFTFDKAGDYPYTCTIHAGMSGKVTVEGAGGTTTTTIPSS